jgi:Tol biopolymer transport system component
MPLLPGAKLGPYTILAPIGSGGMGEVWKATDTRLDRTVAVKVCKIEFSERFEREARAVAALNHPHICHLYDVGPDYLVMEFVEGASLRGPLPVAKAVEYGCQILDALDAAHKIDITHRDLKPGNIVVTRQGIKLLDFGLAKQGAGSKETDATVTSALTSQGQIVGTLQYMSPEQLHGKEADARSDLFSFGCVLYEMLTGERAFDGATAASVIAAILEREPEKLDTTPPLERVIRTCLAKDPEQRFQTALDLKRNLLWALEESPPKRPARRVWLAGVAAAVCAIAGVFGIAYFRQKPADAKLVEFTVNPPENGMLGGYVAVSPDGRGVAYIALDPSGKTMLWVRTVDSAVARPLPGTEEAWFPFWSPDSRWIAFFSFGSLTRSQLKKVDAAGGQVFVVTNSGIGRSGAWSPDGTIYYSSAGGAIRRVSAAGGKSEPVTRLDTALGEIDHTLARLLPDGDHILYLVHSYRPEIQGVWITSARNPGERRRLLPDNTLAEYSAGYLLFIREGVLVAQPFDMRRLELSGEALPVTRQVGFGPSSGNGCYSSSVSGTLVWCADYPVTSPARFTWFDRSGKQLGSVGPPGNYTNVSLSPDGKLIAASSLDGTTGFSSIIFDPLRGTATPVTSAHAMNTVTVWSPDGLRVAYGSIRGAGNVELYEQSARGETSDHALLRNSHNKNPLGWSRDGHLLLYTELDDSGETGIWTLPMDGSQKPAQYLSGDANMKTGQLSPDGRWMAYDAPAASSRQVFVQSFPPGKGKWQVSAEGGTQPRWRRDGRELFYVDPRGRMMSVEIKPGESPDPAGAKVLFEFLGANVMFAIYRYDVAADGQKFLILTPSGFKRSDPLYVVLNWTAGLKH